MSWARLCLLVITVCLVGLSRVMSEEPPKKPKMKVELRWLEMSRVEGLTEDKGIQASCETDDLLYPHRKPALEITREDVRGVLLTEHDLRKNGLGLLYTVNFELTDEARKRLAANCPGQAARVTIGVDGRYWGWSHYITSDTALVSEACKARSYNPSVGFLSSKAEAEKIVEAFK